MENSLVIVNIIVVLTLSPLVADIGLIHQIYIEMTPNKSTQYYGIGSLKSPRKLKQMLYLYVDLLPLHQKIFVIKKNCLATFITI